MAEWFKATDCKSVGGFLRRFESCLSQYQPIFGSSKETGIGSHSLVMLTIQGPLQRKSHGIVCSRRFLSVSSRSSSFINYLIKSLMKEEIP